MKLSTSDKDFLCLRLVSCFAEVQTLNYKIKMIYQKGDFLQGCHKNFIFSSENRDEGDFIPLW